MDERDRMENSVGGEGDPVELSEARVATYPDGKLAIVSTPTGPPLNFSISARSSLRSI